MTTYQMLADSPTRATTLYHHGTGCDVRHKTNRALFACEDKRWEGRIRQVPPFAIR